MKAYLSGAMENAPDFGADWREELEGFLRLELGHGAYNPVREVQKLLTPAEWEQFRTWKLTDFPRFQSVIRRIIHQDLNNLENGSHYVICYWDTACEKGGGTHGELTSAYRREIPVYMVTTLPASQISSWILGCCSRVFSSFDELKSFLKIQYACKS